jgi:serine/threonine-protein kinase
MAAPFDVRTLTLAGGSVSLPDAVPQQLAGNTPGTAGFSVSPVGSLAYMSGPGFIVPRRLAWVDREGREEPINAPPRAYFYARISPDGARAALDIRDAEQDIWIWDFADETLRRLTVEPSRERAPTWTPDGKYVLFDSNRFGPPNLFRQDVDGTEMAERLTQSGNNQFAPTVSSEGLSVLFEESEGRGNRIWSVELQGERRPSPLWQTRFTERNPRISPGGQWLAYESDQSGQFEVYVRPYPDVTKGFSVVSTGGGTRPVWAPRGQELFYESPRGELMMVSVDDKDSWKAGTPVRLFDARYPWSFGLSPPSYDVSPDGKRFLIIKQDSKSVIRNRFDSIVIVSNWLEEVQRLVPID